MPYTHISLSNPADVGRRLDTVLADCVSDLSRSRIQVLIKSGHILVNGRSAKARQPVELDDNVTVEIPAAAPSTAVAEPMDLDILFEDDYLLVLNKPSGMVVHPGAGHGTGTLVLVDHRRRRKARYRASVRQRYQWLHGCCQK